MKFINYLFILFFIGIIVIACNSKQQEQAKKETTKQENPPAAGFNAEASDQKAMDIADKVMKAMGGRNNWDKTRFISWNFFGARDLLWDKHSGEVRIEIPNDTTIFHINIESNNGEAFIKGTQITDQDSLQKLMHKAKGIWINDSYWLVMPYKLKDSGVTLTYKGMSTINGDTPAYVLELKFENVGYTPQNKYNVYVDTTDYLIKQWAYYRSADQDSATAVWPMDNYKKYGNILLSANRSDNRGPRDVHVYDSLPDSVFTTSDFILSDL